VLGRRANQPGADVLVVVHGSPSIGLYAAQAARALSAGSVTVASDDDEVLTLAEAVGATPMRTDLGRRLGRWPIVVDCGTRVEGLHHSLACTAPEGVLHSVSYYAAESMTPMPLGKLYTLGIQFHIGRAHSAAVLPEVIGLVADGRLAPDHHSHRLGRGAGPLLRADRQARGAPAHGLRFVLAIP
jgi:threonine dehydrogenase-like Zn-dependent dehydrogenase